MARSSWLVEEPRRSGILLHPTSLPGPGIGDLGPSAVRWLDWLAEAGQTIWQILPLVPVGGGGSPYDGLSAFAGNELLVNLERLADDGLLNRTSLERGMPPASGPVDFERVARWKDALLEEAFRVFLEGDPGLHDELSGFREAQADWLEDYALFRVLRSRFEGAAWVHWPAPLRDREPDALARARHEHGRDIEAYVFRQFVFDRQWGAVKGAAAERGITLLGDVPIFVSHDSADVWAARGLFHLDEGGQPTVVAGVPPDAFSAEGQRWGNPIPDWRRMEEEGYPWWRRRIERIMQHVDVARIDHFRGFAQYWEVPADEETAVRGRWRPGPGRRLFEALEAALGPLRLVAEDLGLITEDVHRLRDDLRLPGMRVVQFGFDGDPENLHHPANIPEDAVAYTGTHDNDTVVGWYEEGIDRQTRARVDRALGTEGSLHWRLLRAVWESPARFAIAPVQDVLGLGNEARMNVPGTSGGNWSWRLEAGALDFAVAERLRDLTRLSGRIGHHAEVGA